MVFYRHRERNHSRHRERSVAIHARSSLRAQRGNPCPFVFASAAWQSMPVRLCERSVAIHACEFGLWTAALRSQ